MRKLVIISAPYKRQGWYPEVLAGMEAITVEAIAGTIIHNAYVNVAPNPKDWSRLVDKTRDLLSVDYD